jgi:hypothetical protein
MRQGLGSSVVLMMAMAVASGCGEKQEGPSAPSAPEFHTITGTSSGCDIGHINQLVQSYFTNTDRRKTVKDSVGALNTAEAADSFSSTVKRLGFDIMAHIDTVVNNGTAGTASVGSDLVNHLILCMYRPTTEAASYPVTFPEDFAIPLTPAAHGAFKVKPPSSANTTDATPVLSRPVNAPFSGVGVSSGTWSGALSGNTPARVLVYGRPVSGSATSYDWKTIPHNSNFSPPVIVGICIDPTIATTSLLNDDNVGLLPFADAPFLVPGTCSESTALFDAGGPTMFAQRLLRMGASLFGPQALWAAALNPGGLGGTSGGIRTQYGSKVVANVTLTFVQQPTSTKVNAVIAPAVTIRATVQGETTTVPNVSITLGAINNSGANLVLNGTTTQTTDANGVATYTDLSENKSGGSRLIVISAGVGGRQAITVSKPTSAKFNVAPK